MFAYVRLCSLFWEKNVEAQPAKSNGQSSLIQAKLFLNSIESDSCIRKKRRFNDLGHRGWAKDQNDQKDGRLAPETLSMCERDSPIGEQLNGRIPSARRRRVRPRRSRSPFPWLRIRARAGLQF